ncbi:MAG: hypothetical protein JWP25_338 [Bradyrhizobium sp.]|nr:hypothetical protein [Bradyrhizobium sp.]
MKRTAITLTFSADLDRVMGWGDKSSDWVDLIKSRVITSDTYKPEIEVHEIQVKQYDWNDASGYVRPEFVTMVDQLLEIKTIMASVNSNTDPDVMAAALDKIGATLSEPEMSDA